MKTQRSFLIAVLAAALASGSASGGEERGRAGTGEPGLQRVTGTPVYTWLNINNISTILRNNGTSDINVAQTNSGLVYPKGSQKTAMYLNGLLWAAKVAGDPQVRVGGSSGAPGHPEIPLVE